MFASFCRMIYKIKNSNHLKVEHSKRKTIPSVFVEDCASYLGIILNFYTQNFITLIV